MFNIITSLLKGSVEAISKSTIAMGKKDLHVQNKNKEGVIKENNFSAQRALCHGG